MSVTAGTVPRNQWVVPCVLRDYQDSAEAYPDAVWPVQAQWSLRVLTRSVGAGPIRRPPQNRHRGIGGHRREAQIPFPTAAVGRGARTVDGALPRDIPP